MHTMKLELGAEKSASNQQKHGVDFYDAQMLWKDPDYMEIPAKTVDEPRLLVIGKIGDTLWSAVITYREDSIRIISVRRSKTQEINLYES